MVDKPYDGKEDAVKILEGVMKRQNWSVAVRDELAESLVRIVAREKVMGARR